MAPLPPKLRDRLRPVLMLLSSPSDGEALSAARTIGRLLRKHNADWTDLADHVVADVSAPAPIAQPTGWGKTGCEVPAAELAEIVAAIRAHGKLSPKAREFIIDLEARAMVYATVALSPREHESLVNLAASAAARMP